MQAEGRAPLSDSTAVDAADVTPAHRRTGLLLAVAAVVFVLDQVSKAVVVAVMPDRDPIELVGGLLTITYTRNPGAAFSVGTGYTWIFTAVAVGVVILILRTSRNLASTWWAIALGGMLGGALGNLADRLFRSPGFARGHVVDWLELPNWPVFNLADSAIVGAGALMVLLAFRGIGLDGSVERR